jgi:hypothetical protein
MADLTTFQCRGCGASLATSAAPGTDITCEYCHTTNTVPQPGEASRGPGEAPAQPAARGEPASLPETDRVAGEGERPAPGSPADIGYSLADDMPVVGREAPQPERVTEIRPAGAGEGTGPTVADIIAEPLKHGVNVPSDLGEPIVVSPDRVKVLPPQREPRGFPGSGLARRSPAGLLLGILVACCLLPAGLGLLCALTGTLGQLFGQ